MISKIQSIVSRCEYRGLGAGPPFARAGPLARTGLRAPHPTPPSPSLPPYSPLPLSPLPFPPLPSLPLPPLPSPPSPYLPLPLEVSPLNPAMGYGEHCKLSQIGLGRSPSRNRIWCILALESDI